MKSLLMVCMNGCINMVREEKIERARTLSQSIMLLSKRQLNRFSAVVA